MGRLDLGMFSTSRPNSGGFYDPRDVDRSFHASACRYNSGCDRKWTDRFGWMFASHRLPLTTAIFLLTTALTSVTGFLFPIHGLTPALRVGILACVILAVALFALYKEHLVGAWRWIFVITAVASLYLNVFVLVVQSFDLRAAAAQGAVEIGRAHV